MTANNVIKFPILNEMNSPPGNPQSEEELGTYFDQNKKEYIDHICDHYSTSLYNKLGSHGFDVLDEEFITYFSYTVETLRHCLYSSLDIDHPLADHIDKMIDAVEWDKDMPNLD